VHCFVVREGNRTPLVTRSSWVDSKFCESTVEALPSCEPARAAIPAIFLKVVEIVVVSRLFRRRVDRGARGEGSRAEGVEKKSIGGGLLLLRSIEG